MCTPRRAGTRAPASPEPVDRGGYGGYPDAGTGPVLGAAAIVLAVLALRQEPASRGLAIAGLATGAVSVATVTLGVGALLAAVPFLGFLSFLAW